MVYVKKRLADRFKKIVLLIARKNTKSETSSGLSLTEACIGNDGADLVCSSNDDNQAWAKQEYLTVCDGNDNNLTLVADWFYTLYKKYGLRLYKCGYDVKFSKEFLRRMDDYGFDCEIVLQNKDTLSNAMKLCEQDFKAKLINYNENPIDKWCLGNASMEMDNNGKVMAVKINGQPHRRIDGAVTLIIIYEIFRRYRNEISRGVI